MCTLVSAWLTERDRSPASHSEESNSPARIESGCVIDGKSIFGGRLPESLRPITTIRSVGVAKPRSLGELRHQTQSIASINCGQVFCAKVAARKGCDEITGRPERIISAEGGSALMRRASPEAPWPSDAQPGLYRNKRIAGPSGRRRGPCLEYSFQVPAPGR